MYCGNDINITESRWPIHGDYFSSHMIALPGLRGFKRAPAKIKKVGDVHDIDSRLFAMIINDISFNDLMHVVHGVKIPSPKSCGQ